ncbi:MAG: hypothetical protein CMG49_05955 [Candidatus Marinimicrobia bacterium]|nr:hypothetical protein [Candidatus Neomarinimicrobiota bacterium]|tara:strand:+ start:855 stop:1532 length:678 start_codon:yes stop_codon:yes gene_type:complete
MKKQEIKRDIIREKIINFLNYLIDNSKNVWLAVIIIVALIFLSTYLSNQNNKKLADSNLKMGLLLNKSIANNSSDSVLVKEYKKSLNESISQSDYNQSFIYLLSNAFENENYEYLKNLLSDNKFNSEDEMLNAFILRLKAEFLYIDNLSKSSKIFLESIELVPSYDLKIQWSTDLINIYIDNSNINEANNVLEFLKNQIDSDVNLSNSEENNLKFIESKLEYLSN